MKTYSIKEAAEILGISRQTLELWIDPSSKYYKMTAVKIAGHWRIERKELRRMKKLLNDGPEGREGDKK